MISFKFRSILYIWYNFYWVHGNGRSIAFGVCVFLQNKVYLEASDSCTQHSVHVAICIYFLCFVSSSWLWLCCFFCNSLGVCFFIFILTWHTKESITWRFISFFLRHFFLDFEMHMDIYLLSDIIYFRIESLHNSISQTFTNKIKCHIVLLESFKCVFLIKKNFML